MSSRRLITSSTSVPKAATREASLSLPERRSRLPRVRRRIRADFFARFWTLPPGEGGRRPGEGFSGPKHSSGLIDLSNAREERLTVAILDRVCDGDGREVARWSAANFDMVSGFQ